MSAETEQLLQRSLLGEAIDFLEGVAVFVWNEERHYVAVNEAACALVGLSREELVGMRVGALSPNEAADEIEAVRATSPFEGTSSFTRPDGAVVQLSWTTVHTKVAGLGYMVSICRRVG
ncbi:MAG TPA: PAS domain-containing protein [Gaiellaceae bacterium]|jgi:PAS domain S-box-containing protein|nr:PAS domain-containing protein [Gaiellaceae bacterium]